MIRSIMNWILGTSEGDENDQVEAQLGPKPRPTAHTRDQLAHLTPELEQLRKDEAIARDERVKHGSPNILRVKLSALFILEFIGCNLLMRSIGMETPERGFLAASLAASIFYITFYITSRAKHTWLYLGFAVLALALTFLRAEAYSAETDSALTSLAFAIVMLATTLGPALLAEGTWPDFVEAKVAADKLHRIRKRRKQVEKVCSKLERTINQQAEAAERWEHNAAKIKASKRLMCASALSRMVNSSNSPPSANTSKAHSSEHSATNPDQPI